MRVLVDLILFAAYDSPSWSLLLQSIGQRMSPPDAGGTRWCSRA